MCPSTHTTAIVIYHSPEERGTITSKLSWEARLTWGRTNRHRMSRRGYSQFIAGSCVARAAQDKAGFRGLCLLLHECILRGSAKPVNVAMILGIFLVPPEMRRRIRDNLFFRLIVGLIPSSKASGFVCPLVP